MSQKRRDNKGRILATGESQRTDGRYAYKHMDALGKIQFVYSWRLVETDKLPKGKRDDLPLRKKIKEILLDRNDGIDTLGKKMTVHDLCLFRMSQKSNVRRNTKLSRHYLMELLKTDPFGSKCIESVTQAVAKDWLVKMKQRGIAYSTISSYARSLKASFYTAIENDLVRKNPFNFKISDVLENDTLTKVPLTETEKASLLLFTKTDITYKRYYDALIILLGTGLRISELCGLTLNDLDMDNKLINIDHQLLRNAEIGYYIEVPKTKSGIRQLPMSEDVYQAFKRVVANRRKVKPIVVDGYCDFLFLSLQGCPLIGAYYVSFLKNLVNKYNSSHEDKLPNITPHLLRHTFCTDMANKGMNPNTLQYIMGHANITMTLGYYAHGSFASAQAEMKRVLA